MTSETQNNNGQSFIHNQSPIRKNIKKDELSLAAEKPVIFQRFLPGLAANEEFHKSLNRSVETVDGIATDKKYHHLRSFLLAQAKRAYASGTSRESFLRSILTNHEIGIPIVTYTPDNTTISGDFDIKIDENIGLIKVYRTDTNSHSFRFLPQDEISEEEQEQIEKSIQKKTERLKQQKSIHESKLKILEKEHAIAKEHESELLQQKDNPDKSISYNHLHYTLFIVLFLFFMATETISFFVAFANNLFGVDAQITMFFDVDSALRAWSAMLVSIGLFIVATLLSEICLQFLGDFYKGNPKNRKTIFFGAIVSLFVVSIFVAFVRMIESGENISQLQLFINKLSKITIMGCITFFVPFAAAWVLRKIRITSKYISWNKTITTKLAEACAITQTMATSITAQERLIVQTAEEIDNLDTELEESRLRNRKLIEINSRLIQESMTNQQAAIIKIRAILNMASLKYDEAKKLVNQQRNSWLGRLLSTLIPWRLN